MNLEEATFAQRIHHQWQPDVLEIEFSISEKMYKDLTDLGIQSCSFRATNMYSNYNAKQ
jgi:gamma-glutamyltranspeptidase